jgi:hypothetical protein
MGLSGRRATLPLILLCAAALSGCASTRLSRFRAFSQAGAAYVKASQTVLDEAGTAAIRADSAVLRNTRPAWTAQERRAAVIENNELLRQRLAILHNIGAHQRLLQDYFETLAALADSDAPNTLAEASQAAFASVARLSPAIKDARIGKASVAGLVPAVAAPIVTRFKVRALNAELKMRAKPVADELALQEGAFQAVTQELRTDLRVQLNLLETDSIVAPFAAEGALPAEWASRRETILGATAAVESADAASRAARKLREAFTALVENRLDSSGLPGLTAELDATLDIVARILKAQ